MLSSVELIQRWHDMAARGEAHASIRFGDASAAVMAHEAILTMDFMRKHYRWIGDTAYCGVALPNDAARRKLVDCLREADYVGHLRQTEHWYFKPLFDMCLTYYGVKPKETFYAFENVYIARYPLFYERFRKVPIVLCGAKAVLYREVLERRYGFTGIVGTVDCPDWNGLPRAEREMEALYATSPWKLALVCAGAPGKALVVKAKQLGTVGVDFGSGGEAAIQADRAGMDAWDYTEPLKY
ncbi:GT-D fold domain-containing glycosyltransferase [Paenibacillus aurantiacus]|uniref:GT-D fold domain-containing glycosyltransferase n=1 Tax=Paenibacillus aurantiacus TaxID=1936118 RepID=A0ABV5KN89_9BACL